MWVVAQDSGSTLLISNKAEDAIEPFLRRDYPNCTVYVSYETNAYSKAADHLSQENATIDIVNNTLQLNLSGTSVDELPLELK